MDGWSYVFAWAYSGGALSLKLISTPGSTPDRRNCRRLVRGYRFRSSTSLPPGAMNFQCAFGRASAMAELSVSAVSPAIDPQSRSMPLVDKRERQRERRGASISDCASLSCRFVSSRCTPSCRANRQPASYPRSDPRNSAFRTTTTTMTMKTTTRCC